MRGISSNLQIFESVHCLAFLSPNPVLPGHLIVLPKTSVQSLTNLSPEASLDIFQSIQRLSQVLKSHYSCPSFTLEFKDQVYSELFFNLIPRKQGDLVQNDQLYPLLEPLPVDEENLSLSPEVSSLRSLI